MINSSVEATEAKGDALSLNGLRVDDAIAKVNAWLESAGVGKGTVSYRLRDWLFSRQRYWGEPFPIVYGEDGTPHLLPDSALPINLPDVPDYEPRTFDPMDAESNPEAPLSRNEDWVKVELDLGDGKKTYYRDTNTMPNWAGSCWYYMRYIDPADTKHMVEKDEFDYWMGPNHNKYSGDEGGVDLYIGGVEHAVLHLLYSRFWHKVLFDLGYVDSAEPFHKLFNQGMIQAYAYTDDRGQYVPADEVVEGPADASGEPTFTWNGEHANREFGKMGKSLKNIVTPDYMYENYGADTFRLYEMSMGPLDESRPWNTRNVVGGMRFLQRLWRNVVDETTGQAHVTEDTPDEKTLKLLNNTIAEVTAEMEGMRPNTAIAKLIVLNNHLTGLKSVPRAAVEPLILMLAPIAPAHLRGDVEQARSRRIPVRRAVAGGRRTLRGPRHRDRRGADQGQGARQARSAGRHRSGRSREAGAGRRRRPSWRQGAAQGDRQGPEDRLHRSRGVTCCEPAPLFEGAGSRSETEGSVNRPPQLWITS